MKKLLGLILLLTLISGITSCDSFHNKAQQNIVTNKAKSTSINNKSDKNSNLNDTYEKIDKFSKELDDVIDSMDDVNIDFSKSLKEIQR